MASRNAVASLPSRRVLCILSVVTRFHRIATKLAWSLVPGFAGVAVYAVTGQALVGYAVVVLGLLAIRSARRREWL